MPLSEPNKHAFEGNLSSKRRGLQQLMFTMSASLQEAELPATGMLRTVQLTHRRQAKNNPGNNAIFRGLERSTIIDMVVPLCRR